jgi:hypothetical protein
MTAPVEDVSGLPGRTVLDQKDEPIGEVKAIYATEDGFPMWVAIEPSTAPSNADESDAGDGDADESDTGSSDAQTVFIPLARLKEERDGELCVQYSKQHILDAPRPDDEERISAECDREMRIYYALGAADQELWDDNKGYAALVPENFGEAERVEDTDDLDTPDADRRTDETAQRLHQSQRADIRDISADEVMKEEGPDEEEQEGINEDKDDG